MVDPLDLAAPRIAAAPLALHPAAPVQSRVANVASVYAATTVAAPAAVAPRSIAAYYGPAQGKRGVELLRTLGTLSEEYHRVFTYDAARDMMFRTVEDLDGDNVITELYSGAKVGGVSDLADATSKGLTTEHVWPQSEGATEAAKSDMHHLRPADGLLNTHRSNLPYGEVKTAVWASPAVQGVAEISLVGFDAAGNKVFTPRASMRGDLARDQFYFFTRYRRDQPDDYSLRNFKLSLPTLLKWNKDDPVDAAERARNQAIFELQGNRNPYVDHPGYVDRVGFTEALLDRKPTAATTPGAAR
jgi:endonuclease I